jgi:hypothetical protein
MALEDFAKRPDSVQYNRDNPHAYFCLVTLKCNDVSQLRGEFRIADSVAAWRLSCRACICRITSS